MASSRLPHRDDESERIPEPIEPKPSAGERIYLFAPTGLFLLAVFYTLYFARDFILPIVIAVIASFPLAKLVRGLVRFGVPQAVSAALVLAVVIGGLAVATYELADPAASWMGRLPRTLRGVETKIRELRQPMEEVQEAAKKVEELASDVAEGGESAEAPADEPVTVEIREPSFRDVLFSRARDTLAAGVVTLVLIYFLLASGDLFLLKLVRILPTLEDKKRAVDISRQVQADISSYLFTVTLINAGLGVAVGAAMYLLGMPSAPLWGVTAAVLNFVPYLGAIVGIAVLSVAALITFDSLAEALLVPAIYFLLTALEGYFVTPYLLGRRLTLNPVVIFLSLIFWGWLWGVPGALLAVPLLATAKIVCDRVESLQPVGEFLGR